MSLLLLNSLFSGKSDFVTMSDGYFTYDLLLKYVDNHINYRYINYDVVLLTSFFNP